MKVASPHLRWLILQLQDRSALPGDQHQGHDHESDDRQRLKHNVGTAIAKRDIDVGSGRIVRTDLRLIVRNQPQTKLLSPSHSGVWHLLKEDNRNPKTLDTHRLEYLRKFRGVNIRVREHALNCERLRATSRN